MESLSIYIVRCAHRSYRLKGKYLEKYYEAAMAMANERYLEYFGRTYKMLMRGDFNPLWASNTFHNNNIDAKDGFWEINYFYFNISLIKLISRDYHVTVIDETRGQFMNYNFFDGFLTKENIAFQKNPVHPVRLLLHKTKKTLCHSGTLLKRAVTEKKKRFKKNYLYNKQPVTLQVNKNDRLLYLFVHPVGNINLQSYLQWRYSQLLDSIKSTDFKVILISTKDFDDSGETEYPTININRLVSGTDLLKATLQSMIVKWRVKRFTMKELKKSNGDPEDEFFLKNLPTGFLEARKEHIGFGKLFKLYGSGLLIYREAIINKGASVYNYSARKHGLRVLSIAGRILTFNRLSNRFSNARGDYPDLAILPHAMVVPDRISYNTIARQGGDIKLYFLDSHPISENQKSARLPFNITLILQKKSEMEPMIDEVLTALKPIKKEVILNMKMHPNFPMPAKLFKKYSRFPFVNILNLHTPLEDTVQLTDLCIAAYSSAAIDFAIQGIPVVWLTYITQNSLFLFDLYREVGLSSNQPEELKEMLFNLIHDPDYYRKQSGNIYSQMLKLTSCPEGGEMKTGFLEILENEFEHL